MLDGEATECRLCKHCGCMLNRLFQLGNSQKLYPHTAQIQKINLEWPKLCTRLSLSEHTCTSESISSVARVAGADVTSLCVSALCILMTVVQDITLTFINFCIKAEMAT